MADIPHEPHKDDLPDAAAIRAADNRALAEQTAVGSELVTHTHDGTLAIANVIDPDGALHVAVLVEATGIVPPGCRVGRALTLEQVDRVIDALTTAADAVRRSR